MLIRRMIWALLGLLIVIGASVDLIWGYCVVMCTNIEDASSVEYGDDDWNNENRMPNALLDKTFLAQYHHTVWPVLKGRYDTVIMEKLQSNTFYAMSPSDIQRLKLHPVPGQQLIAIRHCYLKFGQPRVSIEAVGDELVVFSLSKLGPPFGGRQDFMRGFLVVHLPKPPTNVYQYVRGRYEP